MIGNPFRWIWRRLFGLLLCAICERFAERGRIFCSRHRPAPLTPPHRRAR